VKKVCCVCGKDLGEVPGPNGRLTHGFCEMCYRSELQAWEAMFDSGVLAADPQGKSIPKESPS
jgi:hypothetical protein